MAAKSDVRMKLNFVLQGVPSARGLDWVDLKLECSIVTQILLELMESCQKLMSKMVEHPNLSQLNQGLQADGTPCRNSDRPVAPTGESINVQVSRENLHCFVGLSKKTRAPGIAAAADGDESESSTSKSSQPLPFSSPSSSPLSRCCTFFSPPLLLICE